MKQSLQLRLGQHLTMTPQLQQAIRLLQLSTTELQKEIQQALDSNLMLERIDEDMDDRAAEASFNGLDEGVAPNNDPEITAPEPEQASSESMEECPVDSLWEDHDTSMVYSQGSDDEPREYETQGNGGESLRAHLLWQMRLTPFSDTDRVIALAIIDSVSDDGYLTCSLEDIRLDLEDELNQWDEVPDLKIEEVEAVLHHIQSFDPPGVAAHDLRECLLLQLKHTQTKTPWREAARQLINDHLGLLASRDYPQMLRQLKLTDTELSCVIDLIQSLNPRPGGQITDSRPQYIIPDVYVRKYKGIWQVELNPDTTPKLRINTHYANLIRGAPSADGSYLKGHLQEARWFIKSVKSRNETLLKVATCIVERQRGFLEHGEEAMKPMVLQDLAEAVSMHESTISRITTQKFMHTPRGIFELKYFFSSHVNTTFGEECSATAIRALIKKLVSGEQTVKPLSDSKIATILLDQGINIARRTVAKYRESLAIPPSNERKRLV